MAAIYCTENQVFIQLGLKDKDNKRYTGNELPSTEEVTTYIEDVQDYIDQYTNTSWRDKTITDEFHSFPTNNFYYQYGLFRNNGYYVQLRNRYVTSLDKLEIARGNDWTDLVATGTEGDVMLEGDYFIRGELGMVWINRMFPKFGEEVIKISYKYGQINAVPGTIRRASILLVAAWLVEAGFDYARLMVGNDFSMDYRQKAEAWENRAMKLLESEFVFVAIPQR